MKAIPSAVNGADLIWLLLLPWLSLAIKLPNLIQFMQQLSKVSSQPHPRPEFFLENSISSKL
jgi:hypothetical protein